MAIRDDIRQRLGSLSPALQQVARYLLDHPNSVVTGSMRSVGARSGSTPATLVRFAQQFGFSGWPQLKEAFAVELGLGPDAYGERARSLIGRAGDHTLMDDLFDAQRRNLDATQRHNRAALPRACALIEKAPTVHVAGFRACYPLAFSFVYLYRLFRSTVQLIDGQGGSLEMQQRALAQGDALVVSSFAPYSREALQVAQASAASGCRIVALTDSATSPLSLLAHESLLFAIDSPSFFPSLTGGVALTEALLTLLAHRAGRDVIGRVDQAETHLFESGAYLLPPRLRGR